MAKGSGGSRTLAGAHVTASERIENILVDIREKGYSSRQPFYVGSVDKKIKDYAKENGIELGSNEMYFTAERLAHARRDSKVAKDLAVSEQDLINFPKDRKKMAIYHNTELKSFIYADDKNKFIMQPNYEIVMRNGKKKVVNFVTAQKLSANEKFRERRYKRLK